MRLGTAALPGAGAELAVVLAAVLQSLAAGSGGALVSAAAVPWLPTSGMPRPLVGDAADVGGVLPEAALPAAAGGGFLAVSSQEAPHVVEVFPSTPPAAEAALQVC